VVLQFFEHVRLGAFDLVEFDCIFGLLLVEGLEQFSHYLSDFGLDLVPLEFSDFEWGFFVLMFVATHYFIMLGISVI